jgi:hypothetical protein
MTAYTLMQSKETERVINLLTKIWEGKKTPDGAVFNKRSIKLALEGMDE